MTGDEVLQPPGSAGAPGDLDPPLAEPGLSPVRDLRGGWPGARADLYWPAGDRLVVSGLPGSGKSTLMRRAGVVAGTGAAVPLIDSQDARERWDARLPGWLPYAVYRPLVRIGHYRSLWRALRSSASVVVHDCGRSSWVRRWIGRHSRRRGRALHLLLLDVEPHAALAGQRQRGRTVSRYAFARHRRAMAALVAQVEAGRLPAGCASVTLLDAATATALERIGFAGIPSPAAPVTTLPGRSGPLGPSGVTEDSTDG